MESSLDWDQKSLISELSQGRELARQLQIHLNAPSSSHEARELLVHKILNSYDKALAILKWNGSPSTVEPHLNSGAIVRHSDSPRSFSGSPKSEDSDRDIKDPEIKIESKKRKSSMPRWTQQVQMCPGIGLEGPLDGYSWRKYGQKDILGAKYPRGYYRCTHRNVQGCLATKQVQRSDEDPMVFEVTYRGWHTCANCSQLARAIPPLSSPEKKLEPNTTSNYPEQMIQRRQTQNQSQEILLDFKTGFKVANEDNKNYHFPISHVEGENNFFSPSTMENDFSGNYFLPSVISTATLSPNYRSVSPSQVAGPGEARNLPGSDSGLMDIVSGATSAQNSPNMGLDFLFGPMDPFEPNFSFDNPNFF